MCTGRPAEEMGTVEFCATISDIVGNCIDVYDGVGEARLATGGVSVVDPAAFVAVPVPAVLIVYAAVLLVLLVEWVREENVAVVDEVVYELVAVVMDVVVDVGFVLV